MAIKQLADGSAVDSPRLREIRQVFDHEARRERLHSTDIAAILGLPGARKGEWEVYAEKRGIIEPENGNKATYAGKILEPPILDVAESELGPLNRNVVCIAPNIDCPIAATLDGQLIDTLEPVEAKTSGIVGPVFGEWGDEGSDVVPEIYLVQVTIQMLCSGADLAHLYALIGGRGFVRYRVMRDQVVCSEIAERCSRWWDLHVVKGIEPTHTEPLPLDVVKRLRREPNKTIELDEGALLAAADFEAAKATNSAAEKTHACAQSRLIELLGDAEAGTLPDGRKVTYLETTRNGYSVLPTAYRTLRIKKG